MRLNNDLLDTEFIAGAPVLIQSFLPSLFGVRAYLPPPSLSVLYMYITASCGSPSGIRAPTSYLLPLLFASTLKSLARKDRARECLTPFLHRLHLKETLLLDPAKIKWLDERTDISAPLRMADAFLSFFSPVRQGLIKSQSQEIFRAACLSPGQAAARFI